MKERDVCLYDQLLGQFDWQANEVTVALDAAETSAESRADGAALVNCAPWKAWVGEHEYDL